MIIKIDLFTNLITWKLKHFIALLVMTACTVVFPCTVVADPPVNQHDKIPPNVTLKPTESILGEYREQKGMFSHKWAIYVLSEGEGEKAEWFIEVNGERLGPFENNSDLISFSPDGNKVVFAAKEKNNDKWDVYVNGKKKWSHEGLAWSSFSWPLGLKGQMFVNQTNAVNLVHSNDSSLVSYYVYKTEGEKTLWANVTNGKEGKYYTSSSSRIKFIGGHPAYWAKKDTGSTYFIVGKKSYGPYKNIYGIKYSNNNKHFSFVAESKDKTFLVIDGKEIPVEGEYKSHTIGNNGKYALAYKKGNNVHVMQNGALWTKKYSDIVWHQFRMTSDANTLAGWFKREGKWFVCVNGTKEYGPYGSYFNVKAGETFSLFLGRTGKNVGYFSRVIDGGSTGYEFLLNGKNIKNEPKFGGLSLSYEVDDLGKVVGLGKMGAVAVDVAAVVDAAAAGAENPLQAKYIGQRLIYTKKKDDQTYVVEDMKEHGPYNSAGHFTASTNGKHYAYIAENKDGVRVILDGKYQTPYYQDVYELTFSADDELAYLIVKDKKVVRAVVRLKGDKPWWQFW